MKMMKVAFGLMFVCLASVIVFVALQIDASSPEKRQAPVAMAASFPQTIELVPAEVQLGTVASHGQSRCSFRFINGLSTQAFIKSVVPSCSCTSLQWPQRAINPGEAVPLDINVQLGGLKGIFRKRVDIVAISEGREYKIEGVINGNAEVVDEMSVTPAVVDFGLIKAGTATSANIVLSTGKRSGIGDYEFRVTDCPVQIGCHPLEGDISPGQSMVLSLIAAARADFDGRHSGEIHLSTNAGNGGRLVIPVTFESEAGFVVEPNIVFASCTYNDGGWSGQVYLSIRSDNKCVVEKCIIQDNSSWDVSLIDASSPESLEGGAIKRCVQAMHLEVSSKEEFKDTWVKRINILASVRSHSGLVDVQIPVLVGGRSTDS